MSFKWHDGHMALFLETYQQYECLWNTKCKDYSKTYVRDKAYSSMLVDLDIPDLKVADIKAKIKTIRTRYGAELKKVRDSETSGADEIYEPRLFWFRDADAFLRSVCIPKQISPNLKDLDSTGRDACSDKTTTFSQHLNELDDEQTTDDEDIGAATPDHIRSSTPVATTPENGANNSRDCKNKARKRSSDTPAQQGSAKKSKRTSSDDEYPNEFDVFCESLAIQLKKMPLERAIICQEKLQKVMTEERLFQVRQSSPSVSSVCLLNRSSDLPSKKSSPVHSIYSLHSDTRPNLYSSSSEDDFL